MVTKGIFPLKEKSPWQNRESNPVPHDQYSETLTTRPRGWSNKTHVGYWSFPSFIITVREIDNEDRFITYIDMPVQLFA
jgi:hypothetical protein